MCDHHNLTMIFIGMPRAFSVILVFSRGHRIGKKRERHDACLKETA